MSKQPKTPAYKTTKVERTDTQNHLDRKFDVTQPNQRGVVWRHHIRLSQGRWVYLAVVLDLYAHRIIGWSLSGQPDAELVIAALVIAYQLPGNPRGGTRTMVRSHRRWQKKNLIYCPGIVKHHI